MVIEETITIRAPLSRVWHLFHDLTCWADWNTVLCDVASAEACLIEGGQFGCSIRPYVFPINFHPKVIEIVPGKKIVWTGQKYGISSLHEFLFQEEPGGTMIRSREVFSGLPIILGGFLFPRRRLTDLTLVFLEDLKRAAEAAV